MRQDHIDNPSVVPLFARLSCSDSIQGIEQWSFHLRADISSLVSTNTTPEQNCISSFCSLGHDQQGPTASQLAPAHHTCF